MDYFSALLEPGDLFTLKQAFQGQGNAMLIGYDLPRLDCTALSTPADESSPIHLILTWYGEGHSLFLNPNLKHKKVMSFRNVRVVLWIAPPSDLFIFNVDKYSNYVRNDRSTNLVYLFDEAPGLRDIKVTHVEDCWLGRFNLLFKVDNLRTQGSQPIFDQYHETYGAILTGFPAKDIRKQYKSQTSHTSIEPDDGSISQDDTEAVNLNLEPFQLHNEVRTYSGDVDEAIETRHALENGHEDPMLSMVQTQPNYRSERSRVSPKPATKCYHSRSIHSAEAVHDPRASVVENVAQDSDSDSDWINTFRYRRLAKRRQQQAAASLRRIRLPRPTVRSQKPTKAPANCAKASIQNCGSKLQERAYAKAGVNDKKIGAPGIAQDSLSKSESGNTNGRSAGEDQTLQTDVHNTSSHTDPPTGTPVALPSTDDSSRSKARIYGTAPIGESPTARRQVPTVDSMRAASRHKKHQQIEDQDPMAKVEDNLLPAGDGTGKATDTRTQRSSTSSRQLTDERTRSLRSAQPTKSPRAGAFASSDLFQGMAFALSFSSRDEAEKRFTESIIQRAGEAIFVY
ncbi:hypothetical protein PGQ11_002972 [Apiospora arundinis]|uniref:FHA domain-containing protein n=1 Tax=Apiospora arundinis TaxID=335852 RepID=A0ABR2J3T0_9PEZI